MTERRQMQKQTTKDDKKEEKIKIDRQINNERQATEYKPQRKDRRRKKDRQQTMELVMTNGRQIVEERETEGRHLTEKIEDR